MSINGFDEITANQFVENFDDFLEFYDRINKVIDISHLKKVKVKKNKNKNLKFDNQKIVFTGFRSKEIETFINDNGGEVTNSISGNTKLLIYINSKKKVQS